MSVHTFLPTRSESQVKADGEAVHRQLSALTSGQRERIDAIIDKIRRRQDSAPQGYAVKFDRLAQKRKDGSDTTDALVARGQLVVSAGGRSRDETRVALRRLDPTYDYAPIRTPDWIVRDADSIVFAAGGGRAAANLRADIAALKKQGIAAALNPIVPLGHTIKGDDLPMRTEVTAGLPATPLTDPAQRVRIAVIDTGITPELRTDQWLSPIPRLLENVDLLDVLPTPGDGRLDWFSGHGSFVSGVVQQIAPLCEIRVYRFTTSDGLGTEKDVAEAMLRAAQDAAADGVRLVINASVGVPAVDGIAPVALGNAVRQIKREHPNVVMVAAAGNNGDTEPIYPAAFPEVIGVGALTAEYEAAPFSSRGDDVDCSAVGVGIVSTFVEGMMPPEASTPQDDPFIADYTFGKNAWALWSGTSFSAPQIAGQVARLSQQEDCEPADALKVLLDGTNEQLAGFGKVIRGLLAGTPAFPPA
jgi:subtilisin family serine protease